MKSHQSPSWKVPSPSQETLFKPCILFRGSTPRPFFLYQEFSCLLCVATVIVLYSQLPGCLSIRSVMFTGGRSNVSRQLEVQEDSQKLQAENIKPEEGTVQTSQCTWNNRNRVEVSLPSALKGLPLGFIWNFYTREYHIRGVWVIKLTSID